MRNFGLIIVNLRQQALRQRHCPILLPSAIVNRHQSRIEIETLHAELEAFIQPQVTAVKQSADHAVGPIEIRQALVDFPPAKEPPARRAFASRGPLPRTGAHPGAVIDCVGSPSRGGTANA